MLRAWESSLSHSNCLWFDILRTVNTSRQEQQVPPGVMFRTLQILLETYHRLVLVSLFCFMDDNGVEDLG